MSELSLLHKWTKKVVEMNNWPHPSDWTNYHYQQLSEGIHEKSGLQIDRNTLRKIVKKIIEGENYSPHTPTKDALAQYIGYENWLYFKENKTKPLNKTFNYLKYPLYLFAILFIVLALIKLYTSNKPETEFTVSNPIGEMPHTLVCNYRVNHLSTNDIYIDYGHVNPTGKYSLYKINKEDSIHKICCHYPGHYSVRLIVDESVHTKKDVWVYSNNWFIYAIDAESYVETAEIPELIKTTGFPKLQFIPFDAILSRETTNEGFFHIPGQKIMDIPGQKINHHLHLKIFKPFGVNSRNCELTIRFKDKNFGEGINCSEAGINIHGLKGDIGYKFTQGGCERYADQRIGNRYWGGHKLSLEHLILNYKNFTTLKIISKSDSISLLIDGEIRNTIKDTQELGEIRGLHFWFKGSPYIDFVELIDGNDKVAFADYFDKVPE